MTKSPEVSVIVPLYKVEQYVKFCVDSILAQTFQDFEIVLVDDASPDGCVALCQKLYGDNSKVKLVRHEKNLGLGAARNTGMKHARGKYVCFVDSDDFILPDTLEKFYTTAEKNNAEVVHAAAWYELNQNEPFPILQQNLSPRLDGYSQEGFLQKNFIQRTIEHLPFNTTAPMTWLYFCRRDFLEKNKIKFLPIISEDEPFHFAMLLYAERYYVLRQAVYIYRKRNDSIMEAKSPDKLGKALDGTFAALAYVRKLLKRVEPFDGCEQWRENILNMFSLKCFQGHSNFYYTDSNVNPEVNAAVQKTFAQHFGNNESFVRFFFNGFHVLNRQVETLSRRSNDLFAQVINLFNHVELAERKIVFSNFMGRGFGCNPKYIALEILRQKLPYDLVWLVRDINEPMPDGIRKVIYGSIDSVYELETAKVIVSNIKSALPFYSKKRGQFFIMTWHGGQSLKKIEKDAEDKLTPSYVAESKANSKITDLMMVGTQEQYDEFRRAFWYDGEILKCGIPRNDIFFRRDENLIAQIRQSLGVPPQNKIVIYAPTFRDDPAVTFANCQFDASRLLAAIKGRFGGDWTLLMRHHPNVAPYFAKNSFGNNVINATAYPDMQELILVSDVLVSDYSSLICDFMFMGKPVFIYAKDFDSYTKERGFKPVFFDLPYKVDRSEEELFNDIETFDANALAPKIKHFIETVKPLDNGHASEEVVKRIKAFVDNTPHLPQIVDSHADSQEKHVTEDIFRQLLTNPIFKNNIDLLTKIPIQEKDAQNVMQTLNLVDDKYFYELMDVKPWKPKILDVPSGIDELLASGKSFCRLGDGECKLMNGISLDFQQYDAALAKKLLQILQDDSTNCYVGIPRYYWYIRDDIERNGNPYHKRYYTFQIPPIRQFFATHCNKTKTYIDACLGGYMSNKSAAFCEERFRKLKTLFNGRKVLVVAGETVFKNITYDFFDGVAQKEFLFAPRVNAWYHYDEILNKILTYPKDFVIALILGPTATVLAYELSKLGYVAYDTGHVPKDYDAFMKGADRSDKAIQKFYAAD